MSRPGGKKTQRVVIYATDIEMLTGLCKRSAYRLMHDIRIAFEKGPRMFITIDEFCLYTGIAKELVLDCIGN